MSKTSIDMILMEIERVQRGDITPYAAAETITDWCEEDIEYERYSTELAEKNEDIRQAAVIHAAFTTGVPDLFSDEMRMYWHAW